MIAAILVLKVPSDLPMFAKRANFSWLSIVLEDAFILYRTTLFVVSAPFILILYALSLILGRILERFIGKFTLLKYSLVYIFDINLVCRYFLQTVALLGFSDQINNSLLVDMLASRLELAPRFLAFSGIDANGEISPKDHR